MHLKDQKIPFYVAHSKKKCARSEFFFSPLLGGVNSDRPGKKINKKYRHNPGVRGAGGF